MKKEELLIERLKKYRKSDMYPFHMPGHKRAKGIKLSFPDPFSVDITEIDGFDNLHHAEGILKDSMEWASCLYGSDRTWYLVNGSTCGLLSAICRVSPVICWLRGVLVTKWQRWEAPGCPSNDAVAQ